jgi:kynurenine formamidase
MRIRSALFGALVIAAAGCTEPSPSRATVTSAPWPGGALVDLSHAYGEDTIFWPTSEPFALKQVAFGPTQGGFFYAANTFSTSEHGGTHLDSPIHFSESGMRVDELPLERLSGPAVVVDVVSASAANADYLVTRADIESWERTHGRIPDDVILLLRTGFSQRWPDAARYLGTAERGAGAVALLHFPGLHPDAARWLIAERRVEAVGIDTASIDYGQSTQFETHRLLAARNIPIFENLTNLDRLPPLGAMVMALPMKIKGGTGAPLRAIAIIP